jgi:hypothetical protein
MIFIALVVIIIIIIIYTLFIRKKNIHESFNDGVTELVTLDSSEIPTLNAYNSYQLTTDQVNQVMSSNDSVTRNASLSNEEKTNDRNEKQKSERSNKK